MAKTTFLNDMKMDSIANWLLLRMEDWPKLEFERNIIIGAPVMTFGTAKESAYGY